LAASLLSTAFSRVPVLRQSVAPVFSLRGTGKASSGGELNLPAYLPVNHPTISGLQGAIYLKELCISK